MKIAFKTVSLLCATSLFTATFSGCDFLGMGSKKETKKEVKSTSVATTQATPLAPKVQASTSLPKDVIVRVGEWSLSKTELDERLKLLKQGLPDFNENDPNTKKMVVDELIRQQLLVKDAEDSKIGNEKEIKDAVEDFRKTLLVQEMANRLTKDVAATEAEALTYYNENKELFVEPVVWKVREIVVPEEATANNILVQILQGADFGALAIEQSKGKTAKQGGELKEFSKAPFEAMQIALANLDVGKTSGVFKGPDGFYIIKVDTKKGGEMRPFDKVKKDLVAGLTLRKQQQAVLEHLNKLAEKNKIEVNQELLGDTTGDRGK
jgi:peptidyl-prolyl cis-trans isomerase C